MYDMFLWSLVKTGSRVKTSYQQLENQFPPQNGISIPSILYYTSTSIGISQSGLHRW